jgi:hypothetical protein
MGRKTVALANTITWGPSDKVYLNRLLICVRELPFATRQVTLRFSNGPPLDLCIHDMDSLVIAYLKMRGVQLAARELALMKPAAPPPCDFLVPTALMARPKKNARAIKRRCSRCSKRKSESNDWYGDLCPGCADATDGNWRCRRCARIGNFEEMDGFGPNNPKCCGLVCKREPD